MNINREIITRLSKWRNAANRKPLILQGARQVGKTYALKQFGKMHFESVAYFNFDEQIELKQFFAQTKDVSRILQNLSLAHGKAIIPEKTLIIFDEIQECNDALNSLKYFNENAPEYAVTCAGSLLGVALNRGASFPVGKVDFMTVYPVSFSEFLGVSGPNLLDYLHTKNDFEPIPELFFNQLVDKFKMYFISGGMPEAIVELVEKQDVEETQQILTNILKAYQLDFSKHTENNMIPKLIHIWNSIPSQLARENKKFVYQLVKHGARAREYEDALLWLSQAGLIYKIFCSKKPALPLSAYDDLSAFKVYLSDVGLLRRLSALDPIAIREGNRLFVEFKGALTENYILQSLISQYDEIPRYWTSGNQAEVDFLIQDKNDIIPIEVKADENINGKSLTVYENHYQPKMRIRFSMKNLKQDGNLINIPLFMSDFTKKIITLMQNQSSQTQNNNITDASSKVTSSIPDNGEHLDN
ncbi:MAG: AAA family ATPase [Paludibacter sp.]|nr:AAA family ATPase [Paludibacter sp.]